MNTSKKTVEAIVTPPPPHMVGDGFRVHNFFPGNAPLDKRRMSPFFLLDYNAKIDFSPAKHQRGVGVHPHRGFETVTIAYHGRIAHHDSAGNSGVIRPGDVQWMTAGSGLLHKEYHEKTFSEEGGLFQMVQLWVNLPAKDKMTKPHYQELSNKQLGVYNLPEEKGKVEVIAGTYNDISGPASTYTPIHVYNLHLKKGAKLPVILPENYNTGLLIIEGSVIINDEKAALDNFVLLKNDGELVEVEATEDSIVLLLSGEPINEPIAQYGPYLMNKWEEVEQAIADMSAGKFGVLED